MNRGLQPTNFANVNYHLIGMKVDKNICGNRAILQKLLVLTANLPENKGIDIRSRTAVR